MDKELTENTIAGQARCINELTKKITALQDINACIYCMASDSFRSLAKSILEAGNIVGSQYSDKEKLLLINEHLGIMAEKVDLGTKKLRTVDTQHIAKH